MNDALRAAEMFEQAATLNREDPLRDASLLRFPNYGQLVMTGDLHGHRRNFQKLQRYCALDRFAARHVVLHELIHEDVQTLTGRDMSFEICLAAADWKCSFPDQVHFLLSNHELAQVGQHEITKNGRSVTAEFEKSVRQTYGSDADRVILAMYEFIRSYPLAGRTANRVFLSHSLPGPRDVARFDPSVLSREPTSEDLRDGGSAHFLVWGRYQTQAVVDSLAELLDVDCFICGHQPQETGYDIWHGRLVILASDHNHGVFLPIDLNKPISVENLIRNIRPFAGVE